MNFFSMLEYFSPGNKWPLGKQNSHKKASIAKSQRFNKMDKEGSTRQILFQLFRFNFRIV